MERRSRASVVIAAAVVLGGAWSAVLWARTAPAGTARPAVWTAAPSPAVAGRTGFAQAATPAKPAPAPAPAAGTQGKPAPAPAPAAAPPAKGAPSPQSGATYIGDESCIGCHEDQKHSYVNTMHGRADHPRAPAAGQGCEACHGPGSVHLDDPTIPGAIKVFAKMAPREVSATCMTCHDRKTHALWQGSVHDARNLSCVTCHSVHSFKSEKAQLKTPTEMGICVNCHRDKVSKLDRSGHMPVREGKMQCSTCHNPHGSTNVRLLRRGDSIAETCTSCHADKRGPYLWEHAPSRDGCTTCHDPHGSANERMLVSKPPILCQRCHVATRHPSTIYDGAAIGAGSNPSIRIYARSCVTCHSNIHGSNHPSGQRFTR